jgi:hypothetical protein
VVELRQFRFGQGNSKGLKKGHGQKNADRGYLPPARTLEERFIAAPTRLRRLGRLYSNHYRMPRGAIGDGSPVPDFRGQSGSPAAFINQVFNREPSEGYALAQFADAVGGSTGFFLVESGLVIPCSPRRKRLIEEFIDAAAVARLDGIFDNSLVFGPKFNAHGRVSVGCAVASHPFRFPFPVNFNITTLHP